MAKFYCEETDEIFSYDDIILNGKRPKCMCNNDYLGDLPWTDTICGTKYNKDGTHDYSKVSDGYHTFEELYDHRTVMFACLCKLNIENSWKSDLHSDGTMYEGMFIVGLKTDSGTVTYHCEDKYRDLFKDIKSLDKAPEWDGATPEDGLEFLKKSFL